MRARVLVTFTCALILSVASILFSLRLAFGFSIVGTNRDLFGVGEPLTYRSAWSSEALNVSKAFEIMQSLGVSRLREWVWRWMFLDESGTGLRENIVDALKEVVMEAKSRNIAVMGMVPDFPSWMTGIDSDYQAVPRRNLTEGSAYKEFLGKYEKSWETLARKFPNITMWEIGNEYNLHHFLHPQIGDFDPSEREYVVTDLLYYGSRGIKLGNPNATTVMGGLGPLENSTYGNGIYNIRDFLNSIYGNIESGNWSSTDPEDFFEVACWHPYIFKEKPTEQNWVDPNIAVHNVMIDHGDGDKPAVFSEFGYSDVCTGLSETQVAEYLNATFTLAQNLTWLKAIYWFRLIDPDPCYDKNLPLTEYGFGLVRRPAEKYAFKPAADAYQTIDEFPVGILSIATVVLTSLAAFLKKTLRRMRVHNRNRTKLSRC